MLKLTRYIFMCKEGLLVYSGLNQNLISFIFVIIQLVLKWKHLNLLKVSTVHVMYMDYYKLFINIDNVSSL